MANKCVKCKRPMNSIFNFWKVKESSKAGVCSECVITAVAPEKKLAVKKTIARKPVKRVAARKKPVKKLTKKPTKPKKVIRKPAKRTKKPAKRKAKKK